MCAAAGFGVAPAAAEPCLAEAVTVRVVRAEDARTLRLDDDRLVRVAGLESFALLDVPAADAALRDRSEALLAGEDVKLRVLSEATDRYGRLPALLGTPDDDLLQARLAGEGLALAFPTSDQVPCFAAVLEAEAEARRDGRGYWAGLRLPSATPASLQGRIGRFAVFEGRVRSVGNRRARTYLNFGPLWSTDVTVEIDGRRRAAFGGEGALAGLAGKRVRVRGFVEERAGPLVRARSPMQVEVLTQELNMSRDRP